MSLDSESVDALIHAITGLSFSDEELAKSHDDIPPYLRLHEVETAEKLRVVRALPVLASSLGPAKTKDVLVPKLDELITASIESGEDELVLEICRQMGEFVRLLGSPSNSECLIGPLGRILCSVEEVVVTEAAADALIEVIAAVPASVLETEFAALITSAFHEDLYCSSRRACARLLAPCYAKVASAELRSELKSRLLQAATSEEEILLVREAAASQLGPLSQLAPRDRQEILGCLATLSADNHRDVRAACVTSLLDVAKASGDKEAGVVQQTLERFADDAHRGTRLRLATNLPQFQAALAARSNKSLGNLFIRLWEDNEPDVRRASAKNLSAFADSSSKEFFNSQLVPKLKEHLVNERDERVRRETIAETVKLLPRLPQQQAAELAGTVLSLVADGGTAAAKQATFEHLADVLTICSAADMRGSVMPALLQLYDDTNWRVRMGAVLVLPQLLDSFEEADIRDTLIPAFVSWLRDSACEIRNSAAAALGRVARLRPPLADGIAGSCSLASLSTDANYQFRKAWVRCAVELMENGPASTQSALVPQLLQLAGDKVPNVRIAVARAMTRLATKLDDSSKKATQQRLADCARDADCDVRFYAAEAAACMQHG